MGVPEVLSSVIEPANKLIDAVTGAIGKAYEPKHMRKMADAKAYELRIIGEELRNNSDLPIVYDVSGNFSIDTSDYEALAKRAGKRIAFQEITKQENIETIVDSAYEAVSGIESCAEGDISREWMHRFIDAAGDISTEEMQKIWSKVLAGEVLDPTSFSLRTLECLRNLDVRDAKLFEVLCSVVISNRFVINDNEFLDSRGITYDSILKLDEGGLINSSGIISFEEEISEEENLIMDFGQYIFMGSSEEGSKFSMQEFPLTTAGRELSKIVGGSIDLETIKEICRIAKKKNPKISLSLYSVKFRNENEINYERMPIPFGKKESESE